MVYQLPERLRDALLAGEQIVARVAPRADDGIAFVWVCPYHQDHALYRRMGSAWMDSNQPRVYQVQHFEAPKSRYHPEHDIEESEFLLNEKHRDLKTIEQVEAVLETLPGDPSQFMLMSEWSEDEETQGWFPY